MKVKIGLYMFLFLFLNSLMSRGSEVGTTGSPVLKIGAGAKAESMGGVGVAGINDASCIFWNPAGTALIDDSQISAMHLEWFSDIRYEWLGFVQPVLSKFAVAGDISYLHMGAIPRTIESHTEGYEQDGSFSPSDVTGRMAFSGRVIKNVVVGVSYQVVRSRVVFSDVIKQAAPNMSAQATSIDMGLIYSLPKLPGLNIGGCLQNAGWQSTAFLKEKDRLPLSLVVGFSYTSAVSRKRAGSGETAGKGSDQAGAEIQGASRKSQSDVLTIYSDVKFSTESFVSLHLGIEYCFANGVSLRGGYRSGTGFNFPFGLSGGFGYAGNGYQVDYAFMPYGELGNTHRVSFTIKL